MENTDIYIYIGSILEQGDFPINNLIKERKNKYGLRDSVILSISTYGGSPDAAFRIGRALQHNYKNVSILIIGPCKSAGTLLAIAANSLIMTNTAELGPLDVQLKKADEIGEASSGLDIMVAVNSVQSMAMDCFHNYLEAIRHLHRISTKTSADIAVKLTDTVVSPIASQIDPIRLGEHQRAVRIAAAYGDRLNQKYNNLKENALGTLIASYPSHEFAIDEMEARELFQSVKQPESEIEKALCNVHEKIIYEKQLRINGLPNVYDYTDILSTKGEQDNEQNISKSRDRNKTSERDYSRTSQEEQRIVHDAVESNRTGSQKDSSSSEGANAEL